MGYRNFEDLEVWKEGKSLAIDVFQLWQRVVKRGYFALQDQMQRSAVSIPSNIAEGSERRTAAEFMRYLYIAKGSAAELRTQFSIFRELDIAKDLDVETFIERTRILSRKLSRLISAVIKKD
jgi:four helix bundle protein